MTIVEQVKDEVAENQYDGHHEQKLLDERAIRILYREAVGIPHRSGAQFL